MERIGGFALARVAQRVVGETHLEVRLDLDVFDQCVRQRSIKLPMFCQTQCRKSSDFYGRTWAKTFIASCGVVLPLVISSSRESVTHAITVPPHT
jgi:hypothetical protein